MDFDRFTDETPYATEPVESVEEAILAFVNAYDNFQIALDWDFHEFKHILRHAMYSPVHRRSEHAPSISLYEIGVVFSPSGADTGKYTVCEWKLSHALKNRADEVKALFISEDGLLPRLIEVQQDFLHQDLPMEIHNPGMRFLNECRRLFAMIA